MQPLQSTKAIYPTTPLTLGGASWSIPSRATQTERLDLGEGTLDDARTNLAEMGRINRVFGGISALTTHLYPRLRDSSATMQIADVGSGAGGFAALLSKWAANLSLPIGIYLLDIAHRNLLIAGESEPLLHRTQRIQADGLRLPFAPNAIDYFVSTLFLHHLEPNDVVEFLATSYRLARRGIVMSDITRGYLPLAAFHLIRPLFARHALTYHDGLLSIRRAYTPSELLALAHHAGIDNPRVHQHFPWRMTLVADKPHA